MTVKMTFIPFFFSIKISSNQRQSRNFVIQLSALKKETPRNNPTKRDSSDT